MTHGRPRVRPLDIAPHACDPDIREAWEDAMRELVLPALMLIALTGGAPAQAPAQTPAQTPARPGSPPAQPAPLDPAQEASKSAFERLAEAERKAIQNDLIWSGDFNGVAGGEFGRRTYDAVLAFERRLRLTADGILTPPERAQLKQAADAARAAVRFNLITDQPTGIRIGLPQSLLTQRVAVENGVVWRRADGLMTLQLGGFPAGVSLAALFEQMRADGPGRRVTYRLQRPEWFVVSGEEGARKFYTRVAAGPQGVRGYTFRYPAAEAAVADRLMIAIANSFEPFPGTDVAANPSRLPAPTAAPASPAAPPALVQPTLSTAAPRYAVSGVSIGGGRVLTSAPALRSCDQPTVNGQRIDAAAAVVTGDVALVVAPGLDRPAAVFAAAGEGPAFTLSFEPGEARAVMLSPLRLEGEGAGRRALSAAQVGAGGAAVIDRQGRVVALLRESPRAQRFVAGVAPEASFALIGSGELEAGLKQAGFTPQNAPRTPAAAAASLVEIRCARRL
jgi:hypothetical protein